jgi:hypothetical protein
MDGLYFLMSVVGIGAIMYWALRNDRVPPDKPTSGLFAMISGASLLKRGRSHGWTSTAGRRPPTRPRA